MQAVLRQDAAFFDVHARSGDLLQGLNEDTSNIQLAIGEKVYQGIQLTFINHWNTLLILSCKGASPAFPALNITVVLPQMGNFIDKMVTFGVGMGIGELTAWLITQNAPEDTLLQHILMVI